MHILLTIVGLIVAGTIWYRRMKIAADAANKGIDAAQRLQGKVRSKRRRDKAAFAPVSAIDHPVVAAATLLRFIAGDDAWGRKREASRAALLEIADESMVDEAVTYAEWAAKQVEHERKSIDTLAAMLRDWLDDEERRRLEGMVEAAAPADADGRARAVRAIERLDVTDIA